MADTITKTQRSEVMKKIRSLDTQPEMRVRRLLFKHGLRYRLHRKSLPGNPDLIFPRDKVLIFVHGCFWHGHPCKIGSGNRKPRTNVEYWIPKIQRNIKRDKDNQAKLADMGWRIIIIWECETKDETILAAKLAPVLEMKDQLRRTN